MDLSQFERNNLDPCVVESPVPECTKSKPCCMGIDEAGRGPVLGPLVYGICYCPLDEDQRLAELGFADSKTLSEEAREGLFTKIDENKEFIGWMIDIISPTFISNNMLQRTKYSLNAISHDSAIALVKRALEKGVNVKELYVDTVGDAKKYEAKLSEIFPSIQVTVTPKADAKFPIVSAASICAKVSRDKALKTWKFLEKEMNGDYGSGYPSGEHLMNMRYTAAKSVAGFFTSVHKYITKRVKNIIEINPENMQDPQTKKWLATVLDPVFGYPQFVRFSWSTASNILESKAFSVEWDDDEEVDESTKNMAPITSFFSQKNKPQEIQRHRFFKERQIEQVADL